MVRENRVKEERFTKGAVAAVAVEQIYASDSGMAVNGQILEVITDWDHAGGSLALVESGLSSREIWRLNEASGTNPIFSYPRALTQASAGSAAAYGVPEPFLVNGPLLLTTGSLVSGIASAMSVIVRYI